MKKNFVLIGLLAFVLFFVAPISAEAAEGGTWKNNANGWWYEFTDGTYLADGFAEIGGVTYYFDAAGWMKTGWVYVEAEVEEDMEPYGDWYYFNNSGAMVKGWVKSGTDWYYMDSEYGYMVTDGFVDDVYYVGSDGKMVTNTHIYDRGGYPVAFDVNGRVIENGWYHYVDYDMMGWVYFGEDASLTTGWLSYGGSWYYLEKGMAAVGTYIMEYEGVEHLYKFATDGRMIADKVVTPGWIESDGYWYYYDGEVLYEDDWYQIGDEWYYFGYDGEMYSNCNKWDSSEYCYYLLSADGSLASNEWVHVYGEYWAYADETGRAYENEWLQLGSTWYYFDWIEMVDAPRVIDGKLHLFASSGKWLGESSASNGWVQTIYGDWYYLENGKLATGWKSIGGKWYYFDTDYYYSYAGDYYEIDGKYYVFDDNAAMVTGWYETDWGWCYAGADGVAHYKGWLQQGNTWYYFRYGYMVQDRMEVVDGEYHLFGKSGAWLGTVEEYTDGWHFWDGSWYYVVDGGIVEYGLKKIDGQIYGFYPSMMTNDFYWINEWEVSGATRLGLGAYIVVFDTNGHMMKNQWYYDKNAKTWIWLDSEGRGVITPEFYYYYG